MTIWHSYYKVCECHLAFLEAKQPKKDMAGVYVVVDNLEQLSEICAYGRFQIIQTFGSFERSYFGKYAHDM